jgi:hypothetical protein
MSRRGKRTSLLGVQRTFEPDRLSPDRLASAYERLVQRHIRVTGELGQTVTQEGKQQRSGVKGEV